MEKFEFEVLKEMITDFREEVRIDVGEVKGQLVALNGRTRRNEERLGVLEDRSEKNVCNRHGERLASLEAYMSDVRTDRRKTAVMSATAVAGIMAALEGLWTWLKTKGF